MTGLLASEGMRVSQLRVRESLAHTNPFYLQSRRTATARKMNPIPYHADYFGHKLHIDQNEKLVMYVVTRVRSGWIQWESSGVYFNASKKRC